MSKFILVHNVSNGTPAVISERAVQAIVKSEVYTGATALCDSVFNGIIEKPFMHVSETPEQIYEMLKS